MQLTDSKKNELTRKLLLSRLRILNDYGFYGLLLMHMKFKLDLNCDTAYTDGYVIAFSPEFLDKLTNREVDFILMHEILHVALKHCFRGTKLNNFLFNVACDIVVNSNILKSHDMDINSICVAGYESMHLAPNGKEGYEYTAEEVYNMFKAKSKKSNLVISSVGDGDGLGNYRGNYRPIDSHDHWVIEDAQRDIDEWNQRLLNAAETVSNRGKGNVPLGLEREIDLMKDSSINWRELLSEFLSFEINDYSFNPPDKRYSDDFFLPDYNDIEEVLDINVLIEVDTSGSISKDDLTCALSEVKGLIDESNGRLKGYLGFYDSEIYDVIPLEDIDISKVKPVGGGGTSVIDVFKNLDNLTRNMDDKVDAIIIITDGEDEFPKEEVRKNIPVLWIINNNEITPPWGIVARMNRNK